MDLGACVTVEREAAAGLPGQSVEAPTADVAIVGAGLAGSLLALVLARRGVSVVIADVHASYRSDFRCEKLGPEQVALLEQLGVADAVRAAFPPGTVLTRLGFRYEQVVNAVRAAWPETVRFVTGRVVDIAGPSQDGAGEHRRTLMTAEGELARARVSVLATGPSPKLAARLGLRRHTIRERHSLCIGFSLARRDGRPLPFDGLGHQGERPGDGIGYASFFPQGRPGVMRVNLFCYRDPREAWARAARRDPLGALLEACPGLADQLRGAEVVEPAELRSTDLYRTEGGLEAGLVLIGDAFQTSCPATAMGVTRLLTDISRLADVQLPYWLASAEPPQFAAYYDDPMKVELDERALRKAELARSTALETGWAWRARRASVGVKRRLSRSGAPSQLRAPRHGDWVEVRSAAEIAATLDADGRLEGLPFMPEMAALCGRRLRVHRRAEKTCVEGGGLRRIDRVVLLEQVRCDGAAHDGCQRGCLMFWKEAWLKPADSALAAPDPFAEADARARLSRLPVGGPERWACQSTALAAITRPLSRFDFGHLAADFGRGEITPRRLGEVLWRTGANRLRQSLGLPDLDQLRGPDGAAKVRLDLRPGERVRLRPPPQVAATLDRRGKNRGLSFEPEMTGYAGQTHTVTGRVERIIHEETGRMVRLTDTVALEGLDCQGRCVRNCPRANRLYWREAWLERVAPPAQPG